MGLLKTSLALALVTTAACGGDDSTTIQLPGADSGGGSDAQGSTDGAGGPDGSALPDGGNPQDSSTGLDSSVTPDASSFAVSAVPGLALWLDATKGVTQSSGLVSKWADQSGNANDAAQANANWQPKLNGAVINGQPALHFKASAGGQGNGYGNMLVVTDSPTLSWGTGDFLIEAVAQYDNNPQDPGAIALGTIVSKQEYLLQSPYLNAGPDLYGNWPTGNGFSTSFGSSLDQTNFISSANTGFNKGKPHVFAVQRVGTTLDLRLDGAKVDTKTVAAINVDKKINLRIGASGDATLYRLDGDVAEIIAVKGPISGLDRTGIEGYLKAKYAL